MPKKNVDNAIQEIINSYKKGLLVNEDRFYNLKWMQQEILKLAINIYSEKNICH